MLNFLKTVLVIVILVPLASCSQNSSERVAVKKEYAKEFVKQALIDRNYKPFYDTLITDEATAIAIAEPILFKIYGKENISKEKPYQCYLIDGYWYISGTLPKGWIGGVVEILISAKDGRVIKLVHGK